MDTSTTHPYTCLSCSLAFVDTTSQREHYGTDLHRYNSKRRVAGLPPVTQALFDEKVQPVTTQIEPEEDVGRMSCKACNKTFNTAATQETHLKSKKHKENVFRLASQVKPSTPSTEQVTQFEPQPSTSTAAPIQVDQAEVEVEVEPEFESSGDAKLDLLVARRLRTAPPIPVTSCLFCPSTFTSSSENVQHMRSAHSFLIPEQEYLVDLEGLLKRLGEEIGTWNVCIHCGKGYGGNVTLDEGVSELSLEELKKKASKGVEAVRDHMLSKGHAKIKYDTEDAKLDLADFYDFRKSYPDYQSKLERREKKRLEKLEQQKAQGWEDIEEEGDAQVEDDDQMEVVYESASDDDTDGSEEDDDELPESDITYGDSNYELVLPSGARIGHRAHRHIHKQNPLPYLQGSNPFEPAAHAQPSKAYKPSPQSQALLKMVSKESSRGQGGKFEPRLDQAGLIPAKGAGFGGKGDVIKAKNKGEAKWAGKGTREFVELKQRAKQEFVRGIRANSQKHFRDHLLQ